MFECVGECDVMLQLGRSQCDFRGLDSGVGGIQGSAGCLLFILKQAVIQAQKWITCLNKITFINQDFNDFASHLR